MYFLLTCISYFMLKRSQGFHIPSQSSLVHSSRHWTLESASGSSRESTRHVVHWENEVVLALRKGDPSWKLQFIQLGLRHLEDATNVYKSQHLRDTMSCGRVSFRLSSSLLYQGFASEMICVAPRSRLKQVQVVPFCHHTIQYNAMQFYHLLIFYPFLTEQRERWRPCREIQGIATCITCYSMRPGQYHLSQSTARPNGCPLPDTTTRNGEANSKE